MANKRNKIIPRESNSRLDILNRDSYYHHSANNYQNAAILAFRLLSREKQLHPNVKLAFDQDLCMRIVLAYNSSCSDCKLPCEIHEWEAMK